MRYAIVDGALVVNIVIWKGQPWSPPLNTVAIPDPTGQAEIGGTWNGTAFTPAPLAPPDPARVAYAAAGLPEKLDMIARRVGLR